MSGAGLILLALEATVCPGFGLLATGKHLRPWLDYYRLASGRL